MPSETPLSIGDVVALLRASAALRSDVPRAREPSLATELLFHEQGEKFMARGVPMKHEPIERVGHRVFVGGLVGVVAGASLLGGCASRSETVPAASPSATTVIVPSPSTTVQRVYTYPEGRYQLYGNGTAQSPHYWVWIPAGANPPVPPPLPRTSVP